MFKLNSFRNRVVFIVTLCMLGIGQAFALVTNCKPSYGGDHIDINLEFDITNNTTSIAPGTMLANMSTSAVAISISCQFNVGDDNNVYFKNNMPDNIKDMLINSGVDILQRRTIGAQEPISITQPTVPDIYINTFRDDVANIALGYRFIINKGAAALKPFDTGVFLLGYHVNDQGQNIGAPVYARFVGNLTLLCPTPKVDITASNGGSVNFGNIKPQDMYANNTVSKNFNLKMDVSPDCETGLNISVRFEPNNNTILDNKNLDMGNGLQVQLSNSSGDIDYDESYFIGEIMPFTPVNQFYTATLSHIPGSNIVSGPFSKTIRVVVSY